MRFSKHQIELLEQRRMLSVTTINAAVAVSGATSNPTTMLGVNLVYWDDQQNTAQTQQMVQAAGLNEFRFPGGSAADEFHFNIAANFGDSVANTLPQFAKFIQSIGGTGIATLDYGSGSPQEAEAEIAYLLGSPSDTTSIGSGLEWIDTSDGGSGEWQTTNWQTVGYWAGLRAASPLPTDDGLNFLRIDQSAPFSGIKSYEVGNELYGSWETDYHGTAGPGGVSTGAQHDPATYAAFAGSISSFVKADHSLTSILIGIDSGDPIGNDDGDWTHNVLANGLADGFVPSFISDHSYMQEPGDESDSFLLNDTVSDTSTDLDWSVRYTDYESLLQQVLGSQASGVQLWATEFNSVSYNPGKQTTSLVNGLFVEDSLGSLMESGYSSSFIWDLRNDFDTGENNSSSLYGWREGGDYGLLGDPNNSALPATGPYVPYPDYFAEQLFSKIAQKGGKVVSAVSTTGSSDFSVYAVKESNGHLDLLIINKSSSNTLTNQFNISGFQPSATALVWQYGKTQDTAQSKTTNGASALANSNATLSLTGSNFSYSFPAYSMTVLDISQSVALSGSNYLKVDGTTPGQLDVWAGTTDTGTPTSTYQLSQISTLSDAGTSGNDTLTIDCTNGNPLAANTSGISFNTTGTSGGTDSIIVIGDNHGDTYNTSSGQMLVSGGSGASVFSAIPITFSNVASESIQAGAGPDALSITGSTPVGYIAPAGGTYPTATLTALSIASGSKLTFNSPNSSRALLELSNAGNWAGQLDLKSNDLLVHGGASAFTTVNSLVISGFNLGAWTGQGITSSSAATNASHLTALGVILNTAGISFDTAPVLTTDVLVKYTYYGDTNFDGKVDGSDYSKIDNGYLSRLTGWSNGDFNYDGAVNGSDYTLIDNAFNRQGTAFTTAVAKPANKPVALTVPMVLSDATGTSTDAWLLARQTCEQQIEDGIN